MSSSRKHKNHGSRRKKKSKNTDDKDDSSKRRRNSHRKKATEDGEDKSKKKKKGTPKKVTEDVDQSVKKVPVGEIVKFVDAILKIESLSTHYSKNLATTGPDAPKFETSQTKTDRNRFDDTYCLEQTRVKLKSTQGTPASDDYIHANYLKFPKFKKSYITTQQPLPKTTSHFWQMIFGEEVPVIISLFAKKSDKLWPDKKDEYLDFGNLTVTCKRVQPAQTKYTPDRRTFEVLPQGCSQSVTVELFEYSMWSKGSSPPSPKVILAILKAANAVKGFGPTVVVCESGTNQSTIYIVVDVILTTLFENTAIELDTVVKDVRKQKHLAIGQQSHFMYALFAILTGLQIFLKRNKSSPETVKRIEALKSKVEKEIDPPSAKPDQRSSPPASELV